MIQSKFKFEAYLFLPFAVVLSALTIFSIINWKDHHRLVESLLIFFMTFASICGVVKPQKICIKNQQIIIRGTLGLGIKKVYNIKKISGYYTGVYTNKGKISNFAYIAIKDKKIATLSYSSHKNYKELMAFIEGNLTNLGPLEITLLSELKSTINPNTK